ncbi:unnamed protein product, partial [Ixodes hexagonus]
MHLPFLCVLLVLSPLERARSATIPYPHEPRLMRKYSQLPDYDTYRLQERSRPVDPLRQLAGLIQLSEAEANGTLLSLRPRPTHAFIVSDRHPVLEQEPTSRSNFVAGALKFLHANKIIFYVACSCVLTGVILLFTLMTVYSGDTRTSVGPSSSYCESHPLLEGSSGIFKKSRHEDDSSDDVSTRLDDEEIDTRTPITPCFDSSSPAGSVGG